MEREISTMAMKLPELDRLVITVVTDNYYDALRPDAAIAARFRTRPGVSLHAEHGFSCFIETASQGREAAFMLDFGLDGAAINHNLEVLGIDLAKTDAFGLSHGHFDHWGALVDILALNREKIRKGTPLYLGEGAFETRYALVPGSADRLEIGRLDREALLALDLVTVREVKGPTEVIPGGFFTGPIERTTGYETASPLLLVQRGGEVEADTFSGEQAMAFNVRGRGLVVLSGCAHAGIVNTIMHVRRMAGMEKVHAIMGGFHLSHASPEKVEKTIADIKAIDPDYVIPAHCTGFEAVVRLSREMAGKFILNTAGTRYRFGA
ncbi:MAG TPA: MBL fold metallo-hydrolase [Syntrophorhabdaceae bacterium]